MCGGCPLRYASNTTRTTTAAKGAAILNLYLQRAVVDLQRAATLADRLSDTEAAEMFRVTAETGVASAAAIDSATDRTRTEDAVTDAMRWTPVFNAVLSYARAALAVDEAVQAAASDPEVSATDTFIRSLTDSAGNGALGAYIAEWRAEVRRPAAVTPMTKETAHR